MTIAKCSRCGGKAQGVTFEEASSKINHAVALSRGIPCGDNFNCVEQVKDESTKESGQDTVVISDTERKPFKTTSFKKPKKQ